MVEWREVQSVPPVPLLGPASVPAGEIRALGMGGTLSETRLCASRLQKAVS